MVDTIKISALPLEISPTSDDIVPMVDGTTSTTKKVSFDDFGKAVNYSNALSTDTANLLNVDGSNKLLLRASDELISTDASNTLSVGTDGKIYGSATALALNENELFVGNASNVPTSTTVADVRALLGKPTGYIDDTIEYVSATQVTWQGVCRDSSDSRDFELPTATTATLSSPTADTTYNLFVAGNTLTDTPVVVWSSGSTPAGYTYYRRVLSIVTDGVGNIIPFTTFSEGRCKYVGINVSVTSFTSNPSTVELTCPPEFKAKVYYRHDHSSNASIITTITEIPSGANRIVITSNAGGSYRLYAQVEMDIYTDINSEIGVDFSEGGTGGTGVIKTLGYYDYR